VLTALALSVVELILLVGAMYVKTRGLGILVTGILGSVALLAAPIRLYFGLSGSQYSGSYAYNGVSYTWREGPGWFMAFFVVAFFLITTVVAFFAARHVTRLGSERVSPP